LLHLRSQSTLRLLLACPSIRGDYEIYGISCDAVPRGFGSSGMAIGVQIAANGFQGLLFKIAAAVEREIALSSKKHSILWRETSRFS
jgi:hypothetical protein